MFIEDLLFRHNRQPAIKNAIVYDFERFISEAIYHLHMHKRHKFLAQFINYIIYLLIINLLIIYIYK